MQSSIQNFTKLIQQLISHLDQISFDSYFKKLSVLENSSIGEHVRHIYNFPECLLNGLQIGVVNYDRRIRNPKLETDRDYAVKCLLEQSECILKLRNHNNGSLKLEVGVSGDFPLIETSLARELHYITEHTIHHIAILRIGMRFHFPELQIEDSFGFSYSTLEYKNFKAQR